MESTNFAIAFLAGLIPALFWVWFWLREDANKPEPYFLIAIAFIAGMAVVPIALPLQKVAVDLYVDFDVMIIWVAIEEMMKYAAALALIFWNREVDEPIDMVIYMVVLALGFAALENALFIFNPLDAGDYFNSALTGGFRFMGATLLHVLASGTVGVFLALTYYRSKLTQVIAGTFGLFMAIVLHALFNFFIMDASGGTILIVFLFVWMGIIILFLLFEKIKILERNHNLQQQLS
ncbi:PrsW family intramembrane metalloprotease [Candidatus Nomurabacteria bacterium]|nr:PrsW family intramembrane metalloprotease [Candidatus Kaiserbacteria bacterium]MCB9815336.1 PrsW family intramembrane metalloprotease [Candidatus Nomurabacteria bacterium]MCB9819559.1 PrsW family intramembrane metalloprotease [Candidatus Nomurabacteria bacterium]